MQGKGRQLLSIFLTALLVLSPLGSAFAAVTSLDHEMGDMNLHGMHLTDADTSNTDSATPDCNHCASDCSGQGNCASGSCGGCVLTIVAAYTSIASHSESDYASLEELKSVSRDSGSPFRPPRA